MANSIQLRNDTSVNWVNVNPILKQGEKGIETNTGREKNGDGITSWVSLKYNDEMSRSGVSGIERNTVLKGGLKLDVVSTKGFGATTYTGDGVINRAIVTGVDMATGNNGGFIWTKNRSSVTDNTLTDTIRGHNIILASNKNSAERYSSGGVKAFTSTGFTAGTGLFGNDIGEDYIAWSFQTTRKTNGSTSIGKLYSADYNPEMGFSVVSWESAGATQSVSHHLGGVPDIIIGKSRSSVGDWWAPFDGCVLKLNSDSGKITSGAGVAGATDTIFNDKMYFPGYGGVDGGNMIAYCFRGVKGFSAFRTYVGTGASGNDVNLDLDMTQAGSFVMIKRLDGTGNWVMVDTTRGTEVTLYSNLSDAEISRGGVVTFTSKGISLAYFSSNQNEVNLAGGQYLIMAFTTNYNKAVDGIPYIEDGTIVTHAEGFDANGAKDTVETKARVNCTLGADGTYYVKDDGTLGANTESLDTLTMVGSGKVDTGIVRVIDGKCFAIEPAPRTAYTQLLSDGTNEVTIAEIKHKVDEPYIGVDGKLVFAYAYVNADGSISGHSRFNISAVVKANTGDYYVYFEKPAKDVYITPVSTSVTTTLHTAQTVQRSENFLRLYTFDSSGAKADIAFTLIVMDSK